MIDYMYNPNQFLMYTTAAMLLIDTAPLFYLLNGQYEIATLETLWLHCEVAT